MPVAHGIWLPKYSVIQSRAKILLFFRNNTQQDDTYSDTAIVDKSLFVCYWMTKTV